MLSDSYVDVESKEESRRTTALFISSVSYVLGTRDRETNVTDSGLFFFF